MGKQKTVKFGKLNKNRLIFFLILTFIFFALLIVRIGFLQFVEGSSLKARANEQQTTTKTIYAERGTIYDARGNVLAISAKVDTVSINPSLVKYNDKSEVNKEFLAHSFSSIFKLDYEELLKKIQESDSYVTITTKVEVDKISELKNWMKENKISSGINIDSSVKRFYPYNTLASNLIGFTGTDNSGLWGLENSLDSILSGTNGKVVTLIDSVNSEIPNQEQTYIEAKNGSNVYLTIDVKIQSIVEKYLSQAVNDNNANSGVAIVMRPSNGDILAMASYPNYDLNSPFTPINARLLTNWDKLSSEEKSNIRYSMWNNIATQNTYEPGSTFKIITSATALEEGLITPDHVGDFYCGGSESVDGVNIHCWAQNPHGSQSLRNALSNSCNPAFIQLGRKIGAKTLYKYYEAFGLFERTNPYFYGEQNSIFFDLDKVNSIELATISFGQRFNITPIQLITAISSIANEGVLVKPRIVKSVLNTNNNSLQEIEPQEVRQVISKENAESLMSMLETVVTSGTGKYAKVSGYSVGGKSGTSEPSYGDRSSGYVASFIGIAPSSNAEVVVLVALFDPKAGSHEGGAIAAPVVSQILSETLPYIGVAPDNVNVSDDSTSYTTTTLPDIKGRSLEDARNVLKNLGFTVHLNGAEDLSTLVSDQTPKPGISLLKDADVYLYENNSKERTSVEVPNFKGMTAAEAVNSAKSKNLNLILNGSGVVVGQDTASGSSVEVGSVITLNLQSKLEGGH